MKNSAFSLFLLASAVFARDPFSPEHTEQCSPVMTVPFTWQLQGVIGRPGHYDAWLISPTEKRQRVRVGDRLPHTAWRVAQIDGQSITLNDGQACQPPVRLVLKGEYHAKESRLDSATHQPFLSR